MARCEFRKILPFDRKFIVYPLIYPLLVLSDINSPYTLFGTPYTSNVSHKYSGINVCLHNNYISLLSSYILSCSPLFLCNSSPAPAHPFRYTKHFSRNFPSHICRLLKRLLYRFAVRICLRKVICMKDEKASISEYSIRGPK